MPTISSPRDKENHIEKLTTSPAIAVSVCTVASIVVRMITGPPITAKSDQPIIPSSVSANRKCVLSITNAAAENIVATCSATVEALDCPLYQAAQ